MSSGRQMLAHVQESATGLPTQQLPLDALYCSPATLGGKPGSFCSCKPWWLPCMPLRVSGSKIRWRPADAGAWGTISHRGRQCSSKHLPPSLVRCSHTS